MHNDWGLIAALIGIAVSTLLAQTTKHQSVSPTAAVLGTLNIPLCIALIWRVALSLGWWTVLAFVVVSLISGTFSAVLARKGMGWLLYATQALQGIVVIACTVLAWVY
ncbi:hypothetical protein [Pectobacterium polaris]|uniref:hypothetical protein n=1 Tax=Pectobacterium polaris TaxID=2042057 RepID=UPI0032E3DEED